MPSPLIPTGMTTPRYGPTPPPTAGINSELEDRPPLPDLEQQLIRRNEERILLKQSADNHEWVGPQGVHHHARAKFRQIVRADHRTVVLGNHVVDPRLVLDQVADARQVEERPF